MKGIVLAGGQGTRLRPMTYITNKHLLPIYDRPMIEYPLQTLTKAGISEILIVSGRDHSGHFMNYLGSGNERGLALHYRVQEGSGGIAEALGLAEGFIQNEKFAVILGDNIFDEDFSETVKEFEQDISISAMLYVKDVDDPNRFGVMMFDSDGIALGVIEKPKEVVSSSAVVGLYFYNWEAFNVIKKLKPSSRGELEISDLNNWYIHNRNIRVERVKGFWSDAGTFESMNYASNYIKTKNEQTNN